jgi:hypothetical protein
MQKVSAFAGFIGGLFVNRHHIEVVEVYKSQILLLESELDYFRREKEKYESLLHEQLGINQHRNDVTEQHQPVHKAMSPLRMRMQLENASRQMALNRQK